MSREEFQSSDSCPTDYQEAVDRTEHESGPSDYTRYTCAGLRAVVMRLSTLGVTMCFYDEQGALAGGLRESDLGVVGFFGVQPGPVCDDPLTCRASFPLDDICDSD